MINTNMKKKEKESVVEPVIMSGVSGHILIRDKKTGEELVNKRNAIHFGNLARITALALTNGATNNAEHENAYINYFAFGNGGSSIDSSGKVLYKTPRVTESFEASASLYNKTYDKDIDPGDDDNRVNIITSTNYTDIKMTATLAYNEPSGQSVFDDSTDNEGDYIFDELGIFTNPTDGGSNFDRAIMLTHVIFHPVQKSQNRIIEIIYTIRIQLS